MRFNEPLYAEFYNKRQIDAGYPGRLLGIVSENISGCGTILDIGSGTGFFSIPLAEKGLTVTAVEPSVPMTNQMMQECRPELCSRIKIQNVTWEEWQGPFHDCALSIHSLYTIKNSSAAIEKMIQYSGKRIIIVRDTTVMKTLSGVIRETLCPGGNKDLNPLIEDLLKKKGMDYNKISVSEKREYRIINPAIEAESLLYQLKLGKDYFHQVLTIINENTRIVPSGLVYDSLFCDIVWIF